MDWLIRALAVFNVVGLGAIAVTWLMRRRIVGMAVQRHYNRHAPAGREVRRCELDGCMVLVVDGRVSHVLPRPYRFMYTRAGLARLEERIAVAHAHEVVAEAEEIRREQ